MSTPPERLDTGEQNPQITVQGDLFATHTEVIREEVKDSVMSNLDIQGIINNNQEVLLENPRRVRIYLLRHYPYMETDDYLAYLPLLEMKKGGQKMSQEQEEKLKVLYKNLSIYSDFNDISSGLQNSITRIFSNPEKTCVVCDNRTSDGMNHSQEKRTVITARSFESQFPGIHSLVEKNLPESDKDAKLIDNQSDLAQMLSKTFSDLEATLPPNVDTVVIVSNRSYVDAFNKIGYSTNLSTAETIKFFEQVGHLSYDFHLVPKKQKNVEGKDEITHSFKIAPGSTNSMEEKIRAFQKAEEIQSRSFDGDIKSGVNGAILSQRIILNKQNQRLYVNTDNIIQSRGSFILSAMVGSGKSLWATDFVKKIISEYPENQIIFFEGNDWNRYDAKSINEELVKKIHNRKSTTLVIDAFDEISSDIDMKKEILEMLKRDWSETKIIITARQSEFHETENTPFYELEFGFDRDDFIELKGGAHKKQIRELFHDSIMSDDILNNPLLVFFICELANNYEQYIDLGILSLEHITQKGKLIDGTLKSLLYGDIIKLVIAKHEVLKPKNTRKFTNNTEVNNLRFQKISENLSKLAMGITLGESYEKILARYNWDVIEKSDFFDMLNILFKKGDNNDYRFAHKSFQEYFVNYYRINCFKEDITGKKWYEILITEKDNILLGLLTSIGLIDFQSFTQDILYLIELGETISINIIFQAIGEMNDPKYYSLVEQIFELPTFQENPNLMRGFCYAIGHRKESIGYPLLEKLFNLPAFQGSSEAIGHFCGTIGYINDPVGYPLLEKVFELPAFQGSSVAISHFCHAIGDLKGSAGYPLLEKVFKLPAFQRSPVAIGKFFYAIEHIHDSLGYPLLEKVFELPAFQGSSEAIKNFCYTIGNLKQSAGYPLLEKVVELPAFQGSSEAIGLFLYAIRYIHNLASNDLIEKIYNLLEKVHNLPDVEENLSLMRQFYDALGTSDSLGYCLAQKIAKLPALQKKLGADGEFLPHDK